MYCTHCGATISADDTFCRGCGVAQRGEPAPRTSPAVGIASPQGSAAAPLALPLAAAGLFVGGTIGFVLRPSAFLIGQLPFGTVISGGANLTGLDMLLRPVAESSLHLMVAVALIGAVVGGIVGLLLRTQPARRG